MIRRISGALALLGWLASLAMMIATALVSSATDVAFVVVGLVFSTVGAVLAARRPENLVSWLLELFGILIVLIGLTGSYALRGLVEAPGSLPAAMTAAWLSVWTFSFVFGLLTSLFLLFPNGRLLSSRWRVVLWAQWVLVAITAVGAAFFTEGGAVAIPGYRNPYLIVSLPVVQILSPSLTLPLVAAALSLVFRSRRARGIERQQLKWVGYSVALFTVIGVAGVSLNALVELGLSGSLKPNIVAASSVLTFALACSFLTLPLAIAVTVLRHRLYEIDILINRTLVYGALTVSLAAAYFAAVVVLQAILRPLTGGSELSVAGSTLAVLALFHPLRRRIQRTVDQRFYRSRYDAQRTFDTFGARLRDEVDLDSVRADLLDVVHETLRPAHASVWLRRVPR